MAQYIDREAAVKLLRNQALEALEYSNTECEVLASVADELEDFPAADVAPVVHACWTNPSWTTYKHGTCSACNWVNTTGAHCNGFRKPNFCPNCGARMDKEAPNGSDAD